MRKSGSIASILVYPGKTTKEASVAVTNQTYTKSQGVIGIIGAGNFTSSTLLLGLSKTDGKIKYIADLDGVRAKNMAKRFNIGNAVSDKEIILSDPDVDTVMVVTRHDAHAPLVLEALKAGKNVFVEKPLCLNEEELEEILEAMSLRGDAPRNEGASTKQPVGEPPIATDEEPTADNQQIASSGIPPRNDGSKGRMVVVGFNRRFAPLAIKLKQLLGEGPKNIVATMNAGFIPPEVWVHDLEIGGGRIIGEACHYIDLCTYLAGSKVKAVCMNSMGTNPQENTDNASILLKYENGTNAVINYFANGSKAYSKERIEAFSQEKTLIIDNWRVLKGYGVKGFSKQKTKLDKGHKNQFKLLAESIKTGQPIIPFDEIVNTTRASFAAIQSLKEGGWVEV